MIRAVLIIQCENEHVLNKIQQDYPIFGVYKLDAADLEHLYDFIDREIIQYEEGVSK